MTSFGQTSSVGLCDESSVSLECMNDKQLNVGITLRSRLSDLPTQSLPDLHDIGEEVFSDLEVLHNPTSDFFI